MIPPLYSLGQLTHREDTERRRKERQGRKGRSEEERGGAERRKRGDCYDPSTTSLGSLPSNTNRGETNESDKAGERLRTKDTGG